MGSPLAPRLRFVVSTDYWGMLSSPPAIAVSAVAKLRSTGRWRLLSQTVKSQVGRSYLSAGLSLGPATAEAGNSRGAASLAATDMDAAAAVSTEAPKAPTQVDVLADRIVSGLLEAGVRCVAFDMDCTAVDRHSRGRLRRSKFSWFLGHVTPAFKALVPKLCDAGIHVAIATASDRAEYRPYAPLFARTTPETHMLGEDLVIPLLCEAVPQYADQFFIVCYNPRARGAEGARPENHGKEHHIRQICSHFNIPPTSVLLLDDEERNHAAHARERSLFTSIKVDGRYGLQLPRLAVQIQKLGREVRIVEL